MNRPTVEAKWCHVIWSTYRHRERFKLAEEAMFCERAIRRVGARMGWPVEAASVSGDSVHVLVRVPIASPRREVLTTLIARARDELIQARKLTRRTARSWARNGWCSVVSNPRAVATTRHYIQARSRMVAERKADESLGTMWRTGAAGAGAGARVTYPRRDGKTGGGQR